jgi:hypothetical protein
MRLTTPTTNTTNPADYTTTNTIITLETELLVQKEWQSRQQKRLSQQCAANGWLKVLQWAKANGCQWNWETCAEAAAGRGQLEVLQWLRANGCSQIYEERVCAAAAKGGHLEVLQWARAMARVHVRGCSQGRPSRGAPVGARQRLPVEQEDLCCGGRGRPP